MIVLFELQKLLKQSRIRSIFVIFLLLFIFVFSFEQFNEDNALVRNKELYTAEIKQLNRLNDKEKIEYLEDKADFYTEALSYHDVMIRQQFKENDTQEEIQEFNEDIVSFYKESDIEEIYNLHVFYDSLQEYLTQTILYDDYLDHVQQGIENVKDGVAWNSYSDAKKAYYEKMEETYTSLEKKVLPLSTTLSFEQFSKSNVDVLFLLAFIILATSILFQVDDKNDMNQLLLSTRKGGYPSALAKIAVLLLTTIVSVITFFALKYILCWILYGSFELGHPIQSTSFFHTSAYDLNVGQVLLLYVGMLCIFLFSIQLLLISLFKALKIRILSLLVLILIFFVSAICFYTIDSTSTWVLWKYLNLFLGFQICIMLSTFHYVSLFSNMVSLTTLFFVFFISIAVLSFIVFILFFHSNSKKLTISYPFEKVLNTLYMHTNLYIHELQKLLFNGKIIGIIIAFIGIGGWIQVQAMDDISEIAYDNELYLSKMFETYGGEMDENKQEIIESKNIYFDDLQFEMEQTKLEYDNGEITIDEYRSVLEKYQSTLKERVSFKQLYEQYEWDSEYLLYAKGYQSVFGTNTNYRDIRNAILVSIFVIISLYTIYTMDQEKDEETLYLVSKKGNRNRLFSKMKVALTLTPIFILYYIVEFLQFNSLYPMHHWNFPLKAIQNTYISYAYPLSENTSLVTYFIVLWGIRLFAILSMSLIILYISKLSKKKILSFLLSFLVIFLPGLLSFVGINFLTNISLLHILMGNVVLQSNLCILLFYIIVDIVLFRQLVRIK